MIEQITNLGTNGMVYRRGHQIVLENEKRHPTVGTRVGEEVDIKISLASGDSVVCQRWYSGA